MLEKNSFKEMLLKPQCCLYKRQLLLRKQAFALLFIKPEVWNVFDLNSSSKPKSLWQMKFTLYV